MSSWDGEQDHSDLYSLKNHSEGERRQDDWDEEYDAGKTKKVKRAPKEERNGKEDKGNVFKSYRTIETLPK